ncbi:MULTISPECIES: type II and III secretion system protein [unclassified Fibrobacter]|uniref:type II and III secretion system protein n=1 Tax=unclassified Fibrobacter TaxID=2634177 RepID=UPI000A1C8183|nr:MULTISPECIES: type II and III secretion system protein [unclassified Fibrobacter]
MLWALFCFAPVQAVERAKTHVVERAEKPVTLDFVDTPIAEVVRLISLAYKTPVLVDDALDLKVTFHLDGVGVLDALTALCSAHGLELVQQESVFHVRRASVRGEHEFSLRDTLVTLSVKDKEVGEFVREFALNSGLNILASPGLEGRITGELRSMPAEAAFRSIMSVHGFRVWREGAILRVESPRLSSAGKASSEASDKIRIYKDGDLYSAEVNDGDLAQALNVLAEVAELNLALYGDIRESMRLKLHAVTLECLIESLFKGRRYSFALEGKTLYVSEGGTHKALSASKLYPLRHVHSERALAYLGKFAPSPNFVATEIKEQNALLLGGSHFEIQMAVDLLKQIDIPALQVTLSCIVVEFKRGRGFEIGLHSGATRKTAERDLGARGYFDFMGKDFSAAGAFGKIGLLPDRFELELASLEENNQAEVLARPRLTTLNGNKAELNVTNTVYYLVSQVSADGYPITDYRSFNDGISLELTPSVTQEGRITLEVSPEIKSAGRSSGDGPRDISTRNLKTMVVLADGETLCLGGLIRKSKSEVRSAVPFLGSIPLLGRLFSYTSEEEEENELAIFITPHVEKAGL